MKHLISIIALLLTATLSAGAEERKPPATQPVNPLAGRWEALSIGGKTPPRKLMVFWEIDDQHVTVTDREGEQLSRNPYMIDWMKEPPQIVMKVEGEKDRIGWFRRKDDKLEILLTVNTGKPPKSWEDGPVITFRLAPKQQAADPGGGDSE